MPYTCEGNWLHEASDTEREHLEAATIGLLARLHDQVPPNSAEFLELPGLGDALRRHVTAQRPYCEWVVDGLARSPLIEDAFERLAELWLYAALRHAVVMPRIACRRAHFGEVAVPVDPDTLILHHGSLRAMVQGSYWD